MVSTVELFLDYFWVSPLYFTIKTLKCDQNFKTTTPLWCHLVTIFHFSVLVLLEVLFPVCLCLLILFFIAHYKTTKFDIRINPKYIVLYLVLYCSHNSLEYGSLIHSKLTYIYLLF